MSQLAVPTSFTSALWDGSLADLTDGDDSTFIRSPIVPDASQDFLISLGALVDPSVDTDHVLRVRCMIDTIGGTPLMLVLLLENADDGSQVTWALTSDLAEAFVDVALALDSADMANIHDYGELRLRGYWYAGETFFTWGAVAGATSYVLQIGSAPWLSDVFNEDVGYVLTYGVVLPHGTYYQRVVPYVGVTPGAPLAEQTVVVP